MADVVKATLNVSLQNPLRGSGSAQIVEALPDTITATMPARFENNYILVWAGLTFVMAAIGTVLFFFAYRMTDDEAEKYALANIERDEHLREVAASNS